MSRLVAGVLAFVIGACTPTAATPGSSASTPSGAAGTPNPTIRDGAEALVADLVASGAPARLGSNFLAQPLPGEGVLVCVGAEAVQVYIQKDHAAALAAASTIDRDDPSKVGTSIVEWVGRPRFWLRDRILVLYVGDNPATDTALRSLLGPPFAAARLPGGPPLPAPDCV